MINTLTIVEPNISLVRYNHKSMCFRRLKRISSLSLFWHFLRGCLVNRSSERLWSFSDELILSVMGEWLEVSTGVERY